uniref:HDC10954 n=1 Tax=Drosophila melanogaster TaxID=7227 RepID=Q6IKZ6_DROME|nr:TPA_inf: HDC10954 [Drosophila melanogaster]
MGGSMKNYSGAWIYQPLCDAKTSRVTFTSNHISLGLRPQAAFPWPTRNKTINSNLIVGSMTWASI